MVTSSIYSAELKHKGKDWILSLGNDTQASRKHYNPGLGKGRGNEFTCQGGKQGQLTNSALQCEHLQSILKCYSPLREEI